MSAVSRVFQSGPVTGHRPGLIVKALLLAVLSVPLAAPAFAQETHAATAAYRLLPGDEITVKMPLNPELDTTGPIGPDGRFSIPLAGRVAIGGMTLTDAEGAIANALRGAQVVADARPGIVVAKYTGVVYVGGEVRAPKPVPLAQALNPMQAIISAGGLLDTARSRKIVIIRQAGQTPHRIETFNMRDLVRTGGSQPAVALAPGDVVFVPKSAIAEVGLFIDQYVNNIVPNALNFNVNLGNNDIGTTTINP